MTHRWTVVLNTGSDAAFAMVYRELGRFVAVKRRDRLMRGGRPPRHVLAVLADTTGLYGPDLGVSLVRIARVFPQYPCVLIAEPQGAKARYLLEAVPEVFGPASAVILLPADEVERPGELDRAIADAQSKATAHEVGRLSAERLPQLLHELLVYAVRHGCSDISPDALAASQGLSRSGLQSLLKRAGFPPPHALAEWARSLVAAKWSENGSRSLSRTAAALRLSSREVLGEQVKRRLGCELLQLKESGAFSWALSSCAFTLAGSPDGLRLRHATLDQPGNGLAL